jgi:hypothetical protein
LHHQTKTITQKQYFYKKYKYCMLKKEKKEKTNKALEMGLVK